MSAFDRLGKSPQIAKERSDIMLQLYFSRHAVARMVERKFSEALVRSIIAYGQRREESLLRSRHTVSSETIHKAPNGVFQNKDIGKTVILGLQSRLDGKLTVITVSHNTAPQPPPRSSRPTAHDRRRVARYHQKAGRY